MKNAAKAQHEPRDPLKWETEHEIQKGVAVLEVQRARMDNGKYRRSFRVSKRVEPRGTSAFLRPQDSGDVRACLDELDRWMQSAPVRATEATAGAADAATP